MSINRDDFTTSTNDFTARLETAAEETIAYMNGETVALAKEAVKHILAIRGNPERTGANLKDLVDAYPGGALGLAGAGLTVLKALAAKRKAAKAAPKGRGRSEAAKTVFGLGVVEADELARVEAEVTTATTTAALDESMRRHPANRVAERHGRPAPVTMMQESLIDLPRIMKDGEMVDPRVNVARRFSLTRALKEATARELSQARAAQDVKDTAGGEAAVGYLGDVLEILWYNSEAGRDKVNLRTAVELLNIMATSASVPATEAAERLLRIVLEANN